MRFFSSLANLLPLTRRKEAERQLRLAQAYEAVFFGQPTRQDQDIVLLDLSITTGFYRVDPIANRDQLQFNEGKRFVFARVFRFLTVTDEERRSFEAAARESSAQAAALANEDEGV